MHILTKISFLCLLLWLSVSCTDKTVSLKVLQLNILHQCTFASGGSEALVNIIGQTDPDVIFLCGLRTGSFIGELKEALQTRERSALAYTWTWVRPSCPNTTCPTHVQLTCRKAYVVKPV